MRRTITVAIPDEAATKLGELAEREYRRPKDQAGILLVRAIEAASSQLHERHLPYESAEESAG